MTGEGAVLGVVKRVFFELLVFLLVVLVLISVCAVFLPILFVFFIFRCIVWCSAKIFRPELRCFLTGWSSLFAFESPKRAFMNIIASGVIDGEVSPERLRELYRERILTLKDENGKLVYGRLHDKWVTFMGYSFWEAERDFKLESHIRTYDYAGDMSLPSPCTEEDYERVFGKLVNESWSEDRSPWESLVVSNFYEHSCVKPKTLVIFRIDHTLCDGYSIMKLIKAIFSTPLQLPRLKILEPISLSPLTKLRMFLRMPYDTVKYAIEILTNARKRIVWKPSGELVGIISPSVTVQAVKAIKAHYEVPYAIVLLSAVQGAIARALTKVGKPIPPKLSSIFVLPLPNHPGGMCVHATQMLGKFTCQATTAVDRLLQVHECYKEIQNSTVPFVNFFFAHVAGCFPRCLRTGATKLGSKIFGPDYIMTTFPTPVAPDFVDGMRIHQLYASVTNVCSVGLSVVVGGMNNNQRVCFTVDKAMFGSEEIISDLGKFLAEEIQELLVGTV